MTETTLGDELIDHTHLLSSSLGNLMQGYFNSDVTFIVENEHFKAHRLILALQSDVFKEMLLGSNFREAINKNEPIPLPDKHAVSFRTFISYLYTALLDLSQLDLFDAIEVFLLAHEFQVSNLVNELSQRLSKRIDFENVFSLFEAALMLNTQILLSSCRDFMCRNGLAVLNHPSFLELSETAVLYLLSCDEFGAVELDIFMAVLMWYSRNSDSNLKRVVEETVRLELVTVEAGTSLATLAASLGILNSHKIDVAQLAAKYSSAPRYRCFLETENQATPERGAVVLRDGEPLNPFYCIDGSFFNRREYFSIQGYETNHLSNGFILIKLGRVCYVDSLFFVAANFSSSSYVVCSNGFRIETSLDKENWQLLAQSTDHLAVQRRLLVFPPRNVLYVKLCGKAMRAYHAFYLLHFECPASSVNVGEVAKTIGSNNKGEPVRGTVLYELEQKRLTVLGSP